MTLWNERHQIQTVVARFREQYSGRLDLPIFDGSFPRDILTKLERLDPETATTDDVAAIIGNRMWAEPLSCHECRKTSWNCVELGEPPEIESSTARICPDCLRLALSLASEQQK